MKRFVHGLMALAVAGGMALAAAPSAEARGRDVGVGIAAGIIGLGVGAAIADSARGTSTSTTTALYPNLSAAENTSESIRLGFTSSGFDVIGFNNATSIYLAIRALI